MAKIVIILEGRVDGYVKNIRESHPEIFEQLKPDKIITVIDNKKLDGGYW